MTTSKRKELRVPRGSKTRKSPKPTKALPRLRRNGLSLVICKEERYKILGGLLRELYPGDRWHFKLCSVELWSEVKSIIEREIAGYGASQMMYCHITVMGQNPENILGNVWNLDAADSISFDLRMLSNMLPLGTRKRIAYVGNARAFSRDGCGFDPTLLTAYIPNMEVIAYRSDPANFVRTFLEENVGPYGLVDHAVMQELARRFDESTTDYVTWCHTSDADHLVRVPRLGAT